MKEVFVPLFIFSVLLALSFGLDALLRSWP